MSMSQIPLDLHHLIIHFNFFRGVVPLDPPRFAKAALRPRAQSVTHPQTPHGKFQYCSHTLLIYKVIQALSRAITPG